MRHLRAVGGVLFFFLALSGCGEGTPAEEKPGPEVLVHTVTAVFKVPGTFAEIPKMLGIGGYKTDELSINPDLIVAMISNPDIGVGKPYVFGQSGVKAAGIYYLGAILFVEGGGLGAMKPIEGKDWSTERTVATDFAGGDVDLGEFTLIPFPGLVPPKN